jgi:ParB family chromosome partitioning protein
MTTPPKRRALGRGLESLLPSVPAPRRDYFLCPIEDLVPQAKQPRQVFDDAALAELAQSIREHGILQPILATREGARLVIIAGERRWRAAQRAGLHEVPVVVRETSAPDAFELALVENLQREDLGPIEAAEAMQRLLEMKGLTQEALAERIGKDRTTVTNTLRLLKLPASVRARVTRGELSEGHARTLLGAGPADVVERLAAAVVAKGLSVRATEALVKSAGASKKGGGPAAVSTSLRDLLRKLERSVGARVRIVDRRGRGRIEILFASEDERERLIERLLR